MRSLPSLCLVVALFLACNPPVSPTPQPDSDLCGAVCTHLGPSGLKCEEGNPVYDSALPGDAGVPNKTCEQFCLDQQKNGVLLNNKCLLQVPSCDQIEAYRMKTCT